jgi:hypothetical protein
VAADSGIGASQVAWFPGLVQGAEGGRNVLALKLLVVSLLNLLLFHGLSQFTLSFRVRQIRGGSSVHFPPHAGRQFAKLIREGQLLAAVGFGTVNDFGQTIAVAMLGRSADALALVEPPPAKPKRHPEDRKVREEES